ncbi:MAG: hypothetical protein ACREU3_10460 [Steroidobacteraceae bacterium]
MASRKSSARARVIGGDNAGGYGFTGELGDLGRHLEVCRALVVVCVEALQAQSADHDAEIALVLRRAVADRLGDEIERVEGLAGRCRHPTSIGA